ncbi:hypothetical protein Pcinc_000662 [Petrolisthes cinctipes]|uniref:Uncharacterized protein n=1 Tax=Petrolisthes cinctipes TaxID=88211 RepID=A0AAE1GMJ2_PETCI|nr:hypothetical protein Pcinc_000662 [Petrolisthes cinctipes]
MLTARVPPGMSAALALPAISGSGQIWLQAGGGGSPGFPVRGGGKGECMRVVAVNVNGMVEKTKRREIVECFKNGGVDVMGVTKTHLKGWGVEECESGGESVM